MSEDKYLDVANKEEIIEKIKTCPTIKEVLEVVNKVYPGWVLYFLDKYSNDYYYLQKNWEIITDKFNIKNSQIIIVDQVSTDDNHSLIRLFSEIFTRCGFIVRSKDEFMPCEVCHKALPTKYTYDRILENDNIKLDINEWSKTCSNCKKPN